MKLKASSNPFLQFCVLLTVVIALSGCEALDNQLRTDRTGGFDKQDYRDALAPRDLEFESDRADSNIPGLKPYISKRTEEARVYPIVSVNINRSVPLRDIFYNLATQSGFDIELDPRITGSVIFSARNRPLDQVVDRIADMAGLRYKLDERVLRVELDTPYNKVYKLDYLSYIRSNSSSISTDISVVSGEGADTGSSFSNSAESEADFWGELEENLELILANATRNDLRTAEDPTITVADQNVNVQAVAQPDADGNIVVSPPDANLTVNAIPASEAEEEEIEAQFVMNKQAGMINIFATERTHNEVDRYLKQLERSVTAQVLIEAKILEVTLADQYSTGIDWRAIDLFSGEFAFNYLTNTGAELLDTFTAVSSNRAQGLDGEGVVGGGAIDALPPRAPATDSSFVVGYGGNDIQALVRAISAFGTTKALASPRLTVLNNQAAVLNVATNRVFFEIDIDVTSDDGTTQTEIESDIRNIPEGVLVNVLPSINLEENSISMAVRPTVTSVVREIPDPGVQFVTASAGITGIENLVPEINVQEIDSVIKMRSGQPIVMGGLLQDTTSSVEDGVPILNDMPLVGNLFKTHSDTIRKTELVIFLKATVLEDPSDSIHNTDRDLYRQFSEDRRPFKL